MGKNESLISITVIAFLVIIGISYVYPSRKDQRMRYCHYREQYSHNLKNPLIGHYRELSCDLSKEIGKEEMKNKDER